RIEPGRVITDRGPVRARHVLRATEAYDAALSQSEQLLDRGTSRLELGLALAQQAVAYLGLRDGHAALTSLRRASDPRVPSLPASELLSVLQLRFQVETQLGRRRDALATYERITHALASDVTNPYKPIADQLVTELATVESLPIYGRVYDAPWRIAAERRTFTLADVDGRITGIDVECDLRTTRIEFQSDAEWSLPESWGSCELFIEADPGTSFVYFEFLDEQQQG
ncbi:MAG: hypothetical protein R3305_07970, partial [Gammaproteobacteria bacterium]|nr:hypothetical protein [Gammaproteobacteria bacterium]